MAEYPKFSERPLHHKLSGFTFILLLILGGFTLYSAFVKETKKQVFKVEKGATAKFDLREERKRFFIPSVSVGIRQWSSSGLETFIEGKVTVEF